MSCNIKKVQVLKEAYKEKELISRLLAVIKHYKIVKIGRVSLFFRFLFKQERKLLIITPYCDLFQGRFQALDR